VKPGSTGGACLTVRVTPRSSRSLLAGRGPDGTLLIRIQAPPVEGRANEALCAFLGELFGVRKSAVHLKRGERGRDKQVVIEGLSPAEADRIVTNALQGPGASAEDEGSRTARKRREHP
jgi:uncharacterized protein (TIGR00251 family)